MEGKEKRKSFFVVASSSSRACFAQYYLSVVCLYWKLLLDSTLWARLSLV